MRVERKHQKRSETRVTKKEKEKERRGERE